MDYNTLIEGLIESLMDACETVSNASGALLAAVPEEKVCDAVFDFIDSVKDGEFESLEDAIETFNAAIS